MAKNATKLIIKKALKLRDVATAVESLEVLVGVPSSEDERESAPGESSDINNATLAYIHDNGAPGSNIPARPFMQPGVKVVKDKIGERLKKGATSILDGNYANYEKNMHAVGLIAQNSIRGMINQGIGPMLVEGTIAARKRRGRTGTKPLIDTGQLRNSITYVIRKK